MTFTPNRRDRIGLFVVGVAILGGGVFGAVMPDYMSYALSFSTLMVFAALYGWIEDIMPKISAEMIIIPIAVPFFSFPLLFGVIVLLQFYPLVGFVSMPAGVLAIYLSMRDPSAPPAAGGAAAH